MNNIANIKKNLSILLIASLILTFFSFSTANASQNIIYETSSKETITSGAQLERITRFTDDGWLNIRVLRVDLSNSNIKVDTMISSESIYKLTSTKALAQSKGAVASINAGFFNWMSTSGNGYPDGPVVESGKIITASSEYNRYSDSMATVAINKLKQVLYNYWKTDITLIAPTKKTITVGQYNKPSKDYTDFTILDRRWSQNSIGVSPNYPDILEMVVDNGVVTEIRQGQPAIEIPQNGYVVITRQAGSQFINENFKAGDNVSFDIKTTTNWKNLAMAVTGSAILVKDGQIPAKFSIDITGRQPRTAVGSSKDGTQLILVTVDGRQGDSIGMTQNELGTLMKELGAYNALNLDGGGSTTMIARKPGTSNLELVNDPSDGSIRAVATAIGIFSLAPPSTLEGLLIDTDDVNVFVNTSRKLSVRGYDKYFNPIEVDPTKVKWSVSGIIGSFKSGAFYPTSVGEAKVTATVGNVSTSINISVLSSPAQLVLNSKEVKLPVNQSKTFTASGKNKNGYSAVIYPEDVKWTVKGNIGKFNKNTFTATTGGTGYIDASMGNTHAYCAVSVSSEKSTTIEGFEKSNASYLAYPTELPGKYEISTVQKHSGKSSGKLTYDFTSLEGTRAAYVVFSNNGIPLEATTTKLGIWVYNSHPNTNWLRAEVYDSDNKKHAVDFTKTLDWTGWKYLEAPLQDIKSPTMLTRVYLAQINPVPEKGYIYIDDLSVAASTFPIIDTTKIPQDTMPVDDANKTVTYQPSDDSFRFAVFGQSQEPKNLLENLFIMLLLDKINNYIDASAFVGGSEHQAASLVKKPTLTTNKGYKSLDIKDARLIQLDMSEQGLRATDPAQWHFLLDQLESHKGNKVFIFLEGSPQGFSDKLESSVLQEVLTEYRRKGKTIWVFYKGNKNESYMEKGIKYISTTGYDIANLPTADVNAVKYVLVTVKGSSVTFEFKPVV